MIDYFNVVDWYFWTANTSGGREALAELESSMLNNSLDSTDSPSLPNVSKLVKRRFSQLSKMIVEVGCSLLRENEQVPIFYVSRFGEINKQYAMSNQIIKTSESLPALFSYSTYNAAIAQLNILLKNNKRSIAISALENQLEIALIQVISFLKHSNEDKVLILIAQEFIPQEYKTVYSDRCDVYCFGMLISIKDGSIKLSIEDNAVNKTSNKILEFLTFLSSDNKSLDLDRVRLVKNV